MPSVPRPAPSPCSRASGEACNASSSTAEPAYCLTDLIGPCAIGDRVVVNTTAVDLGLGTGGFDVVHWNLSRDGLGRSRAAAT